MALINGPDLDITLSDLRNKMAEKLAKYEEPLDILLFGNNKAKHKGKWKTYWEKQSRLEKQRGHMFSMMLEQCSQQLLD